MCCSIKDLNKVLHETIAVIFYCQKIRKLYFKNSNNGKCKENGTKVY